ncbi:HAD-IIB family hydrolase [Thalassovita taeanensis]|uniref:Mannosyl-3-phosphoglycerate phosphatase n=1 Tax=Thalassovita taeanensis TaxID=657014 RepID=A0A1H9I5J5_9RHOB|nr:HAD hydrolase family protein [Thalassovita taeanensis]SEQ69782.1 mannosyl-3-phosphoglycerate phosphatase [Thalassovita taeanensis]
MKKQIPLLVFSDLDGTLIDHDSYSYDAALPALAALRAIGAGVVLASSKTASEISVLRSEMGLEAWPAIVENGAGRLEPASDVGGHNADYLKIRAILGRLPQSLKSAFRGFGDMTVDEVAQSTGLSPAAAALAKRRDFSEPGTWSGTEDDRLTFIAALAREGVSARMGGRFLTLSFGRTKADRMGEMIAHYAPLLTVALGDAPNDVEMLEAADRAFIIANPNGSPLSTLQGEHNGRIRRTEKPGPKGWNSAILDLLSELEQKQERPRNG